MTLQNLLGVSLDAVTQDKDHVAKLLAAAKRNVEDAQLQGLSSENRFDAAYKQRNLSDYSGDLVPDGVAKECLTCAKELLSHLRTWLERHRPELT